MVWAIMKLCIERLVVACHTKIKTFSFSKPSITLAQVREGLQHSG